MIAVTAAATFAILDMYTPEIGSSARAGAGFGGSCFPKDVKALAAAAKNS